MATTRRRTSRRNCPLAARTAGEPGRVLLVALDGENAWEYYPFNGWYFLRAMYAALASHPDIRLATLSKWSTASAGGIAPAPLKQVRRQLGLRHAVHMDG
jgi:alpha-amylase/alpha-mannosidase (GH57 family)